MQPSAVAHDFSLLSGSGLHYSALDTVSNVPNASHHRPLLPPLPATVATGQKGFDRAVQPPRSELPIEWSWTVPRDTANAKAQLALRRKSFHSNSHLVHHPSEYPEVPRRAEVPKTAPFKQSHPNERMWGRGKQVFTRDDGFWGKDAPDSRAGRLWERITSDGAILGAKKWRRWAEIAPARVFDHRTDALRYQATSSATCCYPVTITHKTNFQKSTRKK